MDTSRIIKTVNPAYGSSWSEVQENMLNDEHEKARLSRLMDDIRKNGILKGGTISDYGDGLFLSNGTHRFIACCILGIRDYPIQYTPLTPPEEEFFQSTELIFSTDPLGDYFECISSASFRLDQENWVEVEGISSTKIREISEFTVCFSKVPDKKLSLLYTKFTDLVSCHIPKREFTDFYFSQTFTPINVD